MNTLATTKPIRWVFSGLVLGAVLLLATAVYALQPPAVDAELKTCDPIRQEILRLNQKPAWLGLFYQPRKARLKKRYSNCFQTIQTEEFNYLKQAEIPGHAGPRLPVAEPTPQKRHWWERRH